MTEIYLIRHGQTEWNSYKRFQGQLDIQLDETGISQAERLSERLMHTEFDAIYSSNLKRALVTAVHIADRKGQGIGILPELREVCFGEWEGRTFHEVMNDKISGGWQWFNNPSVTDIPGGETADQVTERIGKALRRVLEKHEGERVALISHGNLIRYVLLQCLKLPDGLFGKMDIGNTSISVLRWENDNFHLHRLNDCAHL